MPADIEVPAPQFARPPGSPAGHRSSAMMPHHPAAPGGQPAPTRGPRIEWSPHDKQLHFVRQNEVTAAYFVGYARAVCGHEIREQGQAPEGAKACFYCLLEAGERR